MTPKVEYLLRLGDASLVLCQRLGEWCGKGPALEEDMALTNVALDLLGEARMWLGYAAELEGAGRDEDALAFFRSEKEFRNPLLVEQPNGSYADTLVRQLFFDAWHHLALGALAESADERIAAIAVKSRKEVEYHLGRSADLVVRLGDGTAESHERVQRAADELWTFTGELFRGDAVDAAMTSDGTGFDPASLRDPWLGGLARIFADATLVLPSPDAFMQLGGKQGRHTEKLSYLLAEMQSLPRAFPGARW